MSCTLKKWAYFWVPRQWYKIDNVQPCPTCKHVQVRKWSGHFQVLLSFARSMKVPAAFFALFHDKSPYLKVILSWNPGLQEVKINRRTAVLDPDFLVGWRHPTGTKLKLLFDQKKHQDSSCFSWNHECLRTEYLWRLLLKWNRDTLPLHFSITNRCHLPSSGLIRSSRLWQNCYDTRFKSLWRVRSMVCIHWYDRWKAILDVSTTTKPGKSQLLWLKFTDTRGCVSRSQAFTNNTSVLIWVTVCT